MNRHELTAGEPIGPLADALTGAEAGQISYLTRDGQPVAALVSIDQLTELQAAQDVRDIAEDPRDRRERPASGSSG